MIAGETSFTSKRMAEHLTDAAYWDQHWATVTLPVAHTWENSTGLTRGILGVIEAVTKDRRPRQVLEVGGAPGGYLAYFAGRYSSEVHSLDYSATGCRATKENFRRLGYPVRVHQADLFAVGPQLPKFDLVYSLGLIEHFEDTQRVVRAHRDLLKPGGLLILGVPHFVWVFWPLLQLLAPRITRGHNRQALAIEGWAAFEHALDLKPLRKCYIGGFQPWAMSSVIDEEYATGGGRAKALGHLLMRLLGYAYAARQRALRMMGRLESPPPRPGSFLDAYGMAAYTWNGPGASAATVIDHVTQLG